MKGATWLPSPTSPVAAGMEPGPIGKGMWPSRRRWRRCSPPRQATRSPVRPAPGCRRPATLHSTLLRRERRRPERSGRRGGVVSTTIPLLEGELTEDDIQTELDNNCQSILGYVALGRPGRRLLDVPDIDDVGLMEDLATLRISSARRQWLHRPRVGGGDRGMQHGSCGRRPERRRRVEMAVDYELIPFRAALSLVLGRVQTSGYTEAILRGHRPNRRRRQPAQHRRRGHGHSTTVRSGTPSRASHCQVLQPGRSSKLSAMCLAIRRDHRSVLSMDLGDRSAMTNHPTALPVTAHRQAVVAEDDQGVGAHCLAMRSRHRSTTRGPSVVHRLVETKEHDSWLIAGTVRRRPRRTEGGGVRRCVDVDASSNGWDVVPGNVGGGVDGSTTVPSSR